MISAKKSTDAAPVAFIFSTPVWGAGHVGLFLNVCLPSLLAPGNLPGMQANPQNRYLVYTRPEDEADLRAGPAFQKLSDIVSVEVILINEEITVPHRTMSDCHIDSIRRADEAGAAAVFLPPDCVWSNGSLARLEQLANQGKSVVHMSGIRLDRDGIVPELAARYSENNLVLSMNARELVGLGLRHLHPIALTHFWNEYAEVGGLMPANLVWTVPGEGLLLRCFHLHPLLVKSQVPFAKFDSTIDDDLALRACPDASRDYVVTDSDELFAFEMSGLSRVVGTVCAKGDTEGVAAWAEVGTNARHRELIRYRIRLHAGPVNASVWAPIEAESDKVVAEVAALNALPKRELMFKHPAILTYRLHAMSLGRGLQGGGTAIAIRFLIWLRATLLNLDARLYRGIFFRRGKISVTHPFWLLQRGLASALEQCVAPNDRNVVLIGADPALAMRLEQARPGVEVQAFAGNAVPDASLVRRRGGEGVDLLVAIDIDTSKEHAPPSQHIGKRQILLRLAGDDRKIEGNHGQVVYFGALGTRICSAVWGRARQWARALKPPSSLAQLPLKLLGLLLSPLIYGSIAIIGMTMNGVGFILDRLTNEQAVFHENERPRPQEPSA